MKQSYSHIKCYKILNVHPDSEWAELRKSYKNLIQKWHPDKFEDGSDKKSAANEKIKQINIAYNQLNNYKRKYGSLPKTENNNSPATPSINANRRAKSAQPQAPDGKQKKQTTKPRPHSPVSRSTNTKSKKYKSLTLSSIAILIISFYLLSTEDTKYNSEEKTVISKPNNNFRISTTKERVTKKHLPIEKTSTIANHKQALKTENTINEQQNFKINIEKSYFTNGSTLGEVISIQGTPTKVSGDIWYYGKSEVHFHEGEVTSWVRDAQTPLRARLFIPSSK